jgi:hypothetical protein
VKKTLFFAGLLLIPLAAWSLGSRQETALVSGQIVEVTGTLRLVGNMPFPQTVVTDKEEQDWYIGEEDKPLFAGLERRVLRVRGTVELVEMRLADDTVIGVRRILKNPRIIAVEPW